MTAQKIATTLRLAACLAAIGAGSAAANTPRTFPYTESFELTAPGTQLVGADGWYGDDPAYLTVQTDAAQPAATPPFPLAAHTLAAQIGGPAELRFQSSAGRTKAYVDLLIKPVRGDRPKTLVTTNYLQYALYVNTAGRIVIHHGNYSWSSPPSYQPFLSYWTELQHTPLSTSALARITITVDYRTFQIGSGQDIRYLRLFQVKLNGVPLTHPDGLQSASPFAPPPQPSQLNGSWFFCLDADDPDHIPGDKYPAGKLGGFGCFGAGAIDDVFVHDSTNVPTHTLTIQSTYAGARGVPAIPSATAYGYGSEVACSVTNSPVSTGAGARMVCTGWIDGTGTVTTTGSSLVTTVTVNRASSLKWNWRQEFLLDTAAGAGGTVDTPDGWYAAGTNVTLEALPATNMVFAGWTGDVPAGSTNSNPLALTMDRTRAVMATFLPGSEPQVAALGTPIAWLQEFGATNNYDQAELEDWDGDGAAGWEEYLAGTDPNDEESVFRLLSQWRSGGMVYISWYGTTNSGVTDGFGVERSGDLSDWTPAVTGGWPRAANGTNVWWDTNPPPTGTRFYRPFIPRD